MDWEIIHLGDVKNGKLILSDPVKFATNLKALFGKVEVLVRKKRKPCSDNQRKYYWKVICGSVADEFPMTPMEVHNFCKTEFLPYDIDSTEMLNSAEREIYHEKIRVYFNTEYNFIIPLPNEVKF